MTTENNTAAANSNDAPVLSLTKKVIGGEKISLTKAHPGLTKLAIGMGWNPRRTPGKDFDVDASAFLVTADGKVRDGGDLIYAYIRKEHASGAIIHSGDNTTGQGEGNDETLTVDLTKVPDEITKLVFTAAIYAGCSRRQNFGMVDGAYACLIDLTSGAELYRFDLSEDASTAVSVILVRVYRHNGEWKFEGVGQGFTGGFKELCAEHGLNVEEEVDE